MVIYLNRRDVEKIVDEMLNSARKVPRGAFTLADILMMNAFERSDLFSRVTNPTREVSRFIDDVQEVGSTVTRKARRKKSAYGKALSRELKQLNRAARTKSGRLRKGITQSSILKKAHRNVKRSIRRRRK